MGDDVLAKILAIVDRDAHIAAFGLNKRYKKSKE
jgi:hypothetical protein